MLFRDYLIGKFIRRLFFVAIFFGVLIFIADLFQIIHLLNFPDGFFLMLMLASYTLFIGVAASIFIASAEFIFSLKEGRFFHILYTFGISDKKVLKILWIVIFFISTLGAVVSFIVNYQKFSYATRLIKFLYGEKYLLSIPPNSFETSGHLSFFYTQKSNDSFKNVIIKTDKELITAKKAILFDNGTLLLKKSSIFSLKKRTIQWMNSEIYTLPLSEKFTYKVKPKRSLENLLFSIVLFIFPALVFPFFFYLILLKVETKFKAYMWAFLFLIIQFGVALLIKAIA